MTQTRLSITFRKTQLEKMNSLLTYLSEKISVLDIKRMRVDITFNFYGGYYNVFISIKGKERLNKVQKIFKSWRCEECC